jgi:hypothetical protein
MHRRDFEMLISRFAVLTVVAGLAAGLGACAFAIPHNTEGPYPKFTDIPLKAGPTTSSSQAEANAAVLRGMASELAAQAQGIAAEPSDPDALAGARATASQVQAPTDADAAATEAFLRSARARATPPPARK